MTVSELRKKLENLPDNMYVFMDERESEFRYGLVQEVEVKEIKFYESPYEDEPTGIDEVLIISE